jgi:F0F1-type ATP synthase assembly protein I
MAAAARYTAVAMTLPAATFAGYLIGSALDSWLHTTYLKIVFLILGILSGFLGLILQLTRDMRK